LTDTIYFLNTYESIKDAYKSGHNQKSIINLLSSLPWILGRHIFFFGW